MDNVRVSNYYMWAVTAAGAAAIAFSSYRFDPTIVDLRFLLLVAFTTLIGARIGIQIPKTQAEITVSDVFIFLTMLLYGGEAAVLLGAAEALCASLRIAKKWRTRLFNTSIIAGSSFLTVWVLQLSFGGIRDLVRVGHETEFMAAVFVMALVQYATNSGLAAVRDAFRMRQSPWQTWHRHYLWTSITYFAGASAAAMIAKFAGTFGTPAFLIALPMIAIIYFTYRTYRKNLVAAEDHAAEQQRISKALRESEEHFRKAFDHAAGMALVSPAGKWLQVNQSLCDILGYPEEELLLRNYQSVTHPDELADSLVKLYLLLEGTVPSDQSEKRYVSKGGREVWVLQSASVVRDEAGAPKHLIFQIQDITERKRAERQVEHAAFHDALTGLPNRKLLSDRLSLALARSERNRTYQFAVLFLDLDRFKVVNDSLGHTMGDRLLVQLAQRLETCMRDADTVARLGGDEFAVILDDVKDPSDAVHAADRIQETLATPFDLNGHQFITSGSIGIAYSMTGYERPEDILRDADTAMYRAKGNGKARYEVFDAEMHERAVQTLQLEADLRGAIEQGQIGVHYQPIYSLTDRALVGFEALARWNHSKLGAIPPARFIPLAEETGLIISLGELVLREACRQMAVWRAVFPAIDGHLTMSVNLSGKQFAQADLVEKISGILAENGLTSRHLRLEITESVIMDKTGKSAAMLESLSALGVQLSIDDFGTGYSSLSYLHRFPFDILKVDRSFVNRMTSDRESEGIIETILTLADKLGKEAIAEGIETEEQLARLRALGCEYGQGYLLCKPVCAEKVAELLAAEQPHAGSSPDAEGSTLLVTLEAEVDAYSM